MLKKLLIISLLAIFVLPAYPVELLMDGKKVQEVNEDIYQEDFSPHPALSRPIPPIIFPNNSELFVNYLNDLEVGSPIRVRELQVFPIYLKRTDRYDYVTLEKALKKHDLWITEFENWGVEKLKIRNKGRKSVFILGGQVLLGGNQNRLLSRDLIIPPRSEIILDNVYCIEEERSTGSSDYFRKSGNLGGMGLRRLSSSSAPQEKVWEVVEDTHGRLGVRSNTKSYHRVYEDLTVKRRLRDYSNYIPKNHFRKAVGMVVVWNGKILGAELFSNKDLFNDLFEDLLYSYLVDCPMNDYLKKYHYSKKWLNKWDVERWLKSGYDADLREIGSPGSGEHWVIDAPKYSGNLITHRNKITHAVLFPFEGYRVY